MIKLDSRKVRKFLAGINEAEYGYLAMVMNTVDSIKHIIKRYEVSKEEFCQEVSISAHDYEAYICGDYDYTLMDMAKINAFHNKKRIQWVEDHPVDIKASMK